jgi:hypothetical protein
MLEFQMASHPCRLKFTQMVGEEKKLDDPKQERNFKESSTLKVIILHFLQHVVNHLQQHLQRGWMLHLESWRNDF